MALNVDSMNSVDDIENIIQSPINNNPKELFIDESKFGKVEKEIESFGDISGIKKENNEIMNDNSLIAINRNISKNVIPKNKTKYLEIKIKNFFENSKINELSTKNKNHNNILQNNKFTSNNNIYDINNIKMNNEKKYNLLFDENKKLDINTLREEYSKIKNDYNYNYNTKDINDNKQRKFVSIFGDNYEKKKSETINLNFDDFKKKNKKRRYNYSYNKIDYFFKSYYKTNNNSKEKNNTDNNKITIFSNALVNNNPINIYNNNNKNMKAIKKNTIFNSLIKKNKSINVKDDNDSWLKNLNNEKNNFIFHQINNIYNSNNNLNIKTKFKTSLFEKLKLNENTINKNFKFITPKSNFIDFKKINHKNKNKLSLISKYNSKNSKYYYNLTNEEKNNSLNSMKKTKISLNKIMENNDNLFDKYPNNNFDIIFNFVENKIKGKNNEDIYFNEFNSRYFNKINNKNFNSKIISISQNIPKRSHLIKLFKGNNNNYKNNFNFKFSSSIKLNYGKNNEKNLFKKLIKNNIHSNNFSSSNFSYNNAEYFKSQNKTKKLLDLL